MSQIILEDPDFGKIVVKKLPQSRTVRIKISDGAVSITAPKLTPNIFIKQFLNSARSDIKKTLQKHPKIDQPPKMTAAELRKYRKKAEAYLASRLKSCAEDAEIINEQKYHYETFRLLKSNTARKWGHCSSRGEIALHPALYRLPKALSDYVIFHELTHLHHQNHGKDFWKELNELVPHARDFKKQLAGYSIAL
jgi:predicted metal-dependent hydrolase